MDVMPIILHEQEHRHQQFDYQDYKRHIEDYLAKIFNSTFTGEVNHPKQQADKESSPLGMLLKDLHELVETERALTCEADETLQKIVDIRCVAKPEEMKTKMTKDYYRFLEIRAERDEKIRKSNEAVSHKRFSKAKGLKPIAHVQDQSFWGTAQQLRSGKVVADFLGGLDPVFGVLLNVTGGRIGKGDTPWFHNLLFKDENSLAYHAAVHDAFGYLITYHNEGPGYNYIKSKWTFFDSGSPMSCQFAGVKFWKRLMQKPDEIDVF